MFNGLGMDLGNLSRLSDAKTRSISAENPTGGKGMGAMKKGGEWGIDWKVAPSLPIEGNREVCLAEIEGPGAIQSMWFAGGVTVWHCILRIYWDGQETPSVEAPLPSFFGAGYNLEQNSDTGRFPTLNSVPVLVAPKRGYNCFWEMPFRKSCRITVENVMNIRVDCYYQINYTLTDVPEDAAYFHAQYRQARPVTDSLYTLLDGVRGKGHYVGTTLSVGLNGTGGWWGEGEFKFFLDGDTEFPTVCGTGTEDYFGGAYDWDAGGYTTYSGPYMGMFSTVSPNGLYLSQQKFNMYRWHVMDPIRFDSDLRVTVQDLGWRSHNGRFLKRRDDFSSTAFWYQTLPTAPFPVFPSADELEP